MCRGCRTGDAGTEADPALEDCESRRAGGWGGGCCGGEGEYLKSKINKYYLSTIENYTLKMSRNTKTLIKSA